MLPDRVSNPGPLTYESGALPIALRGPASCKTDLDFCGSFGSENLRLIPKEIWYIRVQLFKALSA